MRILFANDGIGDAGGVQAYLAAVMPALAERGHEVAFLHVDALREGGESPAPVGAPHFSVDTLGLVGAVSAALEWQPDVAFSHNMRVLDVDRRLAAAVPAVKMMHGYFGTCIGGQKTHLFPGAVPCGRPLGPPCLAIYLPRRCGRLNPVTMLHQWGWAREQNRLFAAYAAFVVASAHMRDEYVRNGADPRRVHAIPLFPTAVPHAADDAPPSVGTTDMPSIGSTSPDATHSSHAAEAWIDAPPVRPAEAADALGSVHRPLRVLFLGRMTRLKGGDVLIRAAAEAKHSGTHVRLTMAGDGPQRDEWHDLARRLGVDASFTGWLDDAKRTSALEDADVLAVPSVWPEPFGLVGPEAGACGVPAVAFDVGGIREWLHDGKNGWLVPGRPKPDTLAAVLVRIARDPQALARMATGARAAAAQLSLARHVSALEEVLREAAASTDRDVVRPAEAG
jgi:glycosyltransferase involved in cell wall biosynthesis